MAAHGRTREVMIATASDLVRVHGFGATSFRDVWEASQTPRGSVYFHFPNGKQELGLEVLRLARDAFMETIHEAARTTRTAQRLIAKLLVLVADQTEASDYTEGCPVAAIALEMSISSPLLREAADAAFASIEGELAQALMGKGMGRRRARRVAGVVIASMEGALLLSKARGDRAPLDDAARVLPYAALSG